MQGSILVMGGGGECRKSPHSPLPTPQSYHMWQSRVEMGHYSVTHFDRITAFITGGAHTRCVNS